MFTINGETWYIELCHPEHFQLKRSDGSASIGACDDIDKTIYLSNALQGEYLKKVLCHEIAHAAMFSYNVDLTLEQEELLADLIATYGKEIIGITNVVFQKLREKPY